MSSDLKAEEKEKVRQELKDLIFRNFGLRHNLSNVKIQNLLREIPELCSTIEVPRTIKCPECNEKIKLKLATDGTWILVKKVKVTRK